MTDRELLEWAAKAAGIDAAWHCAPEEIDEHADYLATTEGMWLKGERSQDNDPYWNPLRNDGDALRLAVKLRLTVDIVPWGTVAHSWNKGGNTREAERHDADDPYAATRLAITKAAAEIAKQESRDEISNK